MFSEITKYATTKKISVTYLTLNLDFIWPSESRKRESTPVKVMGELKIV